MKVKLALVYLKVNWQSRSVIIYWCLWYIYHIVKCMTEHKGRKRENSHILCEIFTCQSYFCT
jgi:hypothetical protein